MRQPRIAERLRPLLTRTGLVLAAAAAAAAGAIAAVVVLEQHVRASNASHVRLVEAKAELNKLQWIPYEAVRTPGASRTQMLALERDLRRTVDELSRAGGAPDFSRLRAALESNFAVLGRIYTWSVTDGKSIEALTPLGFGALATLGSADAALAELGRSYESAARTAQVEAIAGSALAIVLLLAGFSVFYLRATSARRELLARQEELRTALAELEAAERTRDEFVGHVSHELRTPLTSICGFTELLLEEVADEGQQASLEIVQRNGERLLDLVNDLLLTARIESGRLPLELAGVDLQTLAEQAVEAAAPTAERAGVELVLRADHELPTQGDPVRLGQVLDNLLSNAIKFTPPGGSVTVALERRDDRALLTVADTGMGIPEAERGRIFERFFRSSNARDAAVPGTGLGLVVTRGIVEAHGGAIGFESREGAGTTFEVELPLAERPALVAVG